MSEKYAHEKAGEREWINLMLIRLKHNENAEKKLRTNFLDLKAFKYGIGPDYKKQ